MFNAAGWMFVGMMAAQGQQSQPVAHSPPTEAQRIFLLIAAVASFLFVVFMLWLSTRKDPWERQVEAIKKHEQEQWDAECERAKAEGRRPNPKYTPMQWTMR